MTQTLRIGNREMSPEQVIENARKAAGWFRLIGFFSIVNAGLMFAQADIVFVVGLGATMVVDAVGAAARQAAEGGVGTFVTAAAFAIDFLIIGSFFLIWYLSRRGSTAAYVVGLVFYALDSLVMLAFQDWVGLAFHGFFLFMIFGGLTFVRARTKAEEMIAAQTQAVSVQKEAAPLTPPPIPAG